MHKTKLKRISLAVCLALMPFAAQAAGLGRLTVASGLGEPLSAEIELLSTTDEELATLSAAIAPEAAYSAQGLDRAGVQNNIRIDVRKKPNGSAVLKLSSNQPVTDPFVDMLIQVDWNGGRLVREYTLLLDPPGYNTPAATANNTLPTTSSTPSSAPSQNASNLQSGNVNRSNVGGKRAARTPGTPASSPAAAPSEPATEPGAAPQTYTTARGDTLSSIANSAGSDGVSLDQMLVGIYRANKDAFVDGNMNRLKVGQVLRIPTQQEAQAVTPAEASKEVKIHSADWNAYRNRLAGAVKESAPASEEAGNQTASGKITSAAEDKALPPASGPRDVVKLSKSDNAASATNKTAQDRISALQEESIAKDKSLQEANDRVSALEKQVQDMQKLLSIKNQAMADLQKNAAENVTPAKPAPESAPSTETPASASPVAPEPQPAEQKPAQPDAPQSNSSPETKPVPAKAKKPPVVQPEPVVEEPSLLDSLPVDPLLLGGTLGGLILLGGGWLFIRNKRKRNLDSFEKAILTTGGLKANTVFGNTLGNGSVDTGDTSFLTDFSPSGGGMIDTHDVDPIAEAEVYMAYGRDAQAEEILRDAIAKDPKRYELHQKLLEMYAARQDLAAFETMAGEMYSTLGSNDPNWHKVAELGRKLEPENPLYQVDAAAIAAAAAITAANAEASSASDIDDLDMLATSSFASSDFMESPQSGAEPSLDFSFDSDVAEDDVSPAADADSSLDFDLGNTTEPSAQEASVVDTVQLDASDFANADELEYPQMDEPAVTDVEDISFGETTSAEGLDTAGLDFQFDLPEEADESAVQVDISNFDKTLPGIELPEAFPTVEPTAEPEGVKETEAELSDNAFDLQFEGFGESIAPVVSEPEAVAPDVSEDDVVTSEADAVPAMSFEDISFDLDAPAESVASSMEESGVAEESVPDFDKTLIIQPENAEEIVFDTPAAESSSDVDFDLDLAELPTPLVNTDTIEPAEVAEAFKAPEVDLSEISLDLDTVTGDGPVSPAFTNEPAEVDTKLDLVTAYMDMGDNEGARELLEEVLKEGGANQRAKAEEILKSLA